MIRKGNVSVRKTANNSPKIINMGIAIIRVNFPILEYLCRDVFGVSIESSVLVDC